MQQAQRAPRRSQIQQQSMIAQSEALLLLPDQVRGFPRHRNRRSRCHSRNAGCTECKRTSVENRRCSSSSRQRKRRWRASKRSRPSFSSRRQLLRSLRRPLTSSVPSRASRRPSSKAKYQTHPFRSLVALPRSPTAPTDALLFNSCSAPF